MNKKILVSTVLLGIFLDAAPAHSGFKKFFDVFEGGVRTYCRHTKRPSSHVQPSEVMEWLKKDCVKELKLPLNPHYIKENHLWHFLKKNKKLKIDCSTVVCSEKFIKQYSKNITGLTLYKDINVTSQLLAGLVNLQSITLNGALTNDSQNIITEFLITNTTIKSLMIKDTSSLDDDVLSSIVVNLATYKDMSYFSKEENVVRCTF